MIQQAPSDYPNMRDARAQYQNRMEVWTAVDEWRDASSSYRNDPLKSLNPENIQKHVAEMYKQAVRMDKRANGDVRVVFDDECSCSIGRAS